MGGKLPGVVRSDTLARQMRQQVAPYGSWTSPITAASIARGSVSLSAPEVAANAVWWIEGRPKEAGRQVVVRAELDGTGRRDVFGQAFSARSRVHEYGGGAFAVIGQAVVFSNDADGRVYRVTPGSEPLAITPEPSRPRGLRYADFAGGMFCVRESHEGDGEPVNEVVALRDG